MALHIHVVYLIKFVLILKFSGLIPVKVKGEHVIKGQTVTCFTNSEEDAVNLSSAMPFMLETKLKEIGAKFSNADNWACHVAVSTKKNIVCDYDIEK